MRRSSTAELNGEARLPGNPLSAGHNCLMALRACQLTRRAVQNPELGLAQWLTRWRLRAKLITGGIQQVRQILPVRTDHNRARICRCR